MILSNEVGENIATRDTPNILDKMAKGRLLPPSEKKSKILYQLYERASEGNVTA